MKSALVQTYHLYYQAWVEQLPLAGPLGHCREHWLQLLNKPCGPDDYTMFATHLVRVQQVTVPSSFCTLLQAYPSPVNLPVTWTVDATAQTTNHWVGGLALEDATSPVLWPRYCHPAWLWTPAGVVQLLWQAGVTSDATNATALLSKAWVIYDWLVGKGYGHLLLGNACQQLAGELGVNSPEKPDISMLPPAECPLSKDDWHTAQVLLPMLKQGLLIAAKPAPHQDTLFGPVAQLPNNPWTIVHTGSLWFLDAWLHQPDGWLEQAPAINTLLRQSIDTVVLHNMLITDVAERAEREVSV